MAKTDQNWPHSPKRVKNDQSHQKWAKSAKMVKMKNID